jgi:hypothetical protein
MLSGQFVHEGDNARQLMIRAATMPARSLAAVAPDTPTPVVELVARALEFEKAARWESAAAMREAVARVHLELFGAFAREHLKACLEQAPREFESARTEPAPNDAPGMPRTQDFVGMASPSGATPGAIAGGGPGAGSDVATTTAKPVSNRRTDGGPRRRRGALVGLVATLIGLPAGVLVVRSVRGVSPNISASSPARPDPPPVTASTLPPAPPNAASAGSESPPASPSPEGSAASGSSGAVAITRVTSPRTVPQPASSRAAAGVAVASPFPPDARALPSPTSAEARQRDPLKIELQ